MGLLYKTLLDKTERPKTLEIGTIELVGADSATLGPYCEGIFSKR